MNDMTARRKMVLDRVVEMTDEYFMRVEAFVAGLGYTREEKRERSKRPAKPKAKAKPLGRPVRLVVDNTRGESIHG
jgi:hypothetical protein